MDEKTIRLTVITPERTVVDETVRSAVVPACDGEWGILPGHADFIAMLGCGVLRFQRGDDSEAALAVRGGFAQIHANTIAVLTPESVRPEDLDPKALDAEQERLSEAEVGPDEFDAHARALAWVRARRKAAERKTGL